MGDCECLKFRGDWGGQAGLLYLAQLFYMAGAVNGAQEGYKAMLMPILQQPV